MIQQLTGVKIYFRSATDNITQRFLGTQLPHGLRGIEFKTGAGSKAESLQI